MIFGALNKLCMCRWWKRLLKQRSDDIIGEGTDSPVKMEDCLGALETQLATISMAKRIVVSRVEETNRLSVCLHCLP